MNMMTDPPLLDEARLAELASEIGADDLDEVMSLFLMEALEAVALLETDLDEVQLAKTTHFLRSGALNIGLAGVAREAQRARGLPPAERHEAAARVARAIDASRAALATRPG